MATTTNTSTLTSKAHSIPLKASPSPSTTAATLRSLYPRAAKAFLQRDISLTYSLLTSAFSIILPPEIPTQDSLHIHRRKWDILRITLETTVYASPPPPPTPSDPTDTLPPALRSNLLLSPQSLLTALHTRSLRLFTPSSPPQKPNPAFLPPQVLVTLVLGCLKLECEEVGRGMIDDWLARRGEGLKDEDGYEKVLEVYCLHVLPRLGEWEYAKDFLQFENELPIEKRERMIQSLQYDHAQTKASRSTPKTHPPRTPSPTPSTSSSISTSSTHTAVPLTPRARATISSFTPSISTTSLASSSSSTITPQRQASPHLPFLNGNANASVYTNGSATNHPTTKSRQSLSSVSSPLPHPPTLPPIQRSSSPTTPNILSLIKASIRPHLTTSKILSFVLLFVIFPLVSLLVRVRRRKLSGSGSGAGVGSGMGSGSGVGARATAEEVRKSLMVRRFGEVGVVGRLWKEVVRAVGDGVRMGGRGLV
ncbi:hypothetical protein JAAARDRAFT_157256 [Jaapia argillacea MUCL 33604]|uniref:Uncharacterized protein n=1 Tax=Jaapia argillacea MUCL 33604 TaxID=933084 RepID=A0A067Q0W8_9AGAM|nr:hypothetical protein JAAARDRAFT_157256 [Jaapia argillacea MUCL 33604]